ncbi:MAG: peptide chain release factor N(5)-glutamine methyltransferase [Spirochaetaceae bacterium]|jgi:release factor glutamine methyltransferase|nr:peptide chain release factor N(5)-glutamine methyltransferase [Spirochaetaceae bacterium]
MTLREAGNEGRAVLRRAGVESYAADSALLLTHALGIGKHELLIDAEKEIKKHDYENYKTLLARRSNNECTAYITNKKEFRFLEFYVDKNVLVPRPDTEILVEAALDSIDELFSSKKTKTKTNIIVLDMCTGSGAVGLSLKYERPFIQVYASDISAAALETAKKNASKHQLQDKIFFLQSDVYENITQRFDIITANAPYIPCGLIETLQAEAQNEPHIALDGGKDGLEIISRVIKGAKKRLFHGGHIFLEASPEQMEKITLLLKSAGFADVKIYKDLSGADRVIGGGGV